MRLNTSKKAYCQAIWFSGTKNVYIQTNNTHCWHLVRACFDTNNETASKQKINKFCFVIEQLIAAHIKRHQNNRVI